MLTHCPTKLMVADTLTKLAAREVVSVLLAAMDSQLPAITAACRTSVTPGPANRGDIAGDGPGFSPKAANKAHPRTARSLSPSLQPWARSQPPGPGCSAEMSAPSERPDSASGDHSAGQALAAARRDAATPGPTTTSTGSTRSGTAQEVPPVTEVIDLEQPPDLGGLLPGLPPGFPVRPPGLPPMMPPPTKQRPAGPAPQARPLQKQRPVGPAPLAKQLLRGKAACGPTPITPPPRGRAPTIPSLRHKLPDAGVWSAREPPVPPSRPPPPPAEESDDDDAWGDWVAPAPASEPAATPPWRQRQQQRHRSSRSPRPRPPGPSRAPKLLCGWRPPASRLGTVPGSSPAPQGQAPVDQPGSIVRPTSRQARVLEYILQSTSKWGAGPRPASPPQPPMAHEGWEEPSPTRLEPAVPRTPPGSPPAAQEREAEPAATPPWRQAPFGVKPQHRHRVKGPNSPTSTPAPAWPQGSQPVQAAEGDEAPQDAEEDPGLPAGGLHGNTEEAQRAPAVQPAPKRRRPNRPNRPGQAARAYRGLEKMAEAFRAAEAAEAALAAAARLPPATPVQQGGSAGSSLSAAPLPSRSSPPRPEETEVDEDLQQAILDSLQPDSTIEEAEPEPPTTPTARAPAQPATEEQPAGGSLWYL